MKHFRNYYKKDDKGDLVLDNSGQPIMETEEIDIPDEVIPEPKIDPTAVVKPIDKFNEYFNSLDELHMKAVIDLINTLKP